MKLLRIIFISSLELDKSRHTFFKISQLQNFFFRSQGKSILIFSGFLKSFFFQSIFFFKPFFSSNHLFSNHLFYKYFFHNFFSSKHSLFKSICSLKKKKKSKQFVLFESKNLFYYTASPTIGNDLDLSRSALEPTHVAISQ